FTHFQGNLSRCTRPIGVDEKRPGVKHRRARNAKRSDDLFCRKVRTARSKRQSNPRLLDGVKSEQSLVAQRSRGIDESPVKIEEDKLRVRYEHSEARLLMKKFRQKTYST